MLSKKTLLPFLSPDILLPQCQFLLMDLLGLFVIALAAQYLRQIVLAGQRIRIFLA